MTQTTILVANRGEIAVRILQAVAELGWRSVAIYAEDDHNALHLSKADSAVPLRGTGPAAYLDGAQILQVAQQQHCVAIHPGYGFLSENAGFARMSEQAGVTFVGPAADVLSLFGDKARARALAQQCEVPVLAGLDHAVTVQEAQAFFDQLPAGSALVIKAVAGGGGRGMRIVQQRDAIAEAYQRCQSEAQAAFGDGALYVEQCAPQARHIEVQIIGDGETVVHVHERECTLQRRHQKLIEIAPSPSLTSALREQLTQAAVRMAQQVGYRGLGTFEFLVFEQDGTDQFVFIEANPRLQVEHTVTEAVSGLDLVQIQLQLALGASLADLQLQQHRIPAPQGFAIQARINMETLQADGSIKPGGGCLRVFDLPGGPGVRVDSCGYTGYHTNPRYDSLLAKLIVHSRSAEFAVALNKASRALEECRIDGVPTNTALLHSLLTHPALRQHQVHTRFVDDHLPTLLGSTMPNRYPADTRATVVEDDAITAVENALHAPMQGTIVSVEVAAGDTVRKGQTLLVMDAMKMEHVISAPRSGVVQAVLVRKGDAVFEQQPLLQWLPSDDEADEETQTRQIDPDWIRPDLQEAIARHAYGLDASRPAAVAKRRKTGQRTARENIADL